LANLAVGNAASTEISQAWQVIRLTIIACWQ
jgi:hypothetical protein